MRPSGKIALVLLLLGCSSSGKSRDGGTGGLRPDVPADMPERTDVDTIGGGAAGGTGGVAGSTTVATLGNGGAGGIAVAGGSDGSTILASGGAGPDSRQDLGVGGTPVVLDVAAGDVVPDSSDAEVPDVPNVPTIDTATSDPPRDVSADVPMREAGQVPDTGTDEAGGNIDAGPPPPALVTFLNGQAQGAMTGYGWVDLGARDSVSSPTCGGAAITNASRCAGTSTTWTTPDGLCVRGEVPMLPSLPSLSDYDQDWGIAICVDATAQAGGTLGQAYKTIKLSYTGVPSPGGVRLLVHRAGDDPALPWTDNYCRNLSSSPSQVSLGGLNTKCWDGSGTTLTAADVPNIDRVCLFVPSDSFLITVDNLCLTGISFGY